MRNSNKRGSYLRVADSKKQKRWGVGCYYIAGHGVIDKDADLEKLARENEGAAPVGDGGKVALFLNSSGSFARFAAIRRASSSGTPSKSAA